jgi:hypothetical protein
MGRASHNYLHISKSRPSVGPMREIPMIDLERGSFHTHGQAVALIAAFYKASYSRLVGLVRKGFRSLDPEEMVEELFVKILAQVDGSADDPPIPRMVPKWPAARTSAWIPHTPTGAATSSSPSL